MSNYRKIISQMFVNSKRKHTAFWLIMGMMVMLSLTHLNPLFTVKAQAATLTSSSLIAITDQNTKQILIMDSLASDWNDDSAVKWSWSPKATNGFLDTQPGWRLPNDVKIRNSSFFNEQVMTVTDSDGFCAIIPYPSGNGSKWHINLGLGVNPVSSEVLPDGNIAIAAAAGGWVRIYTASQGGTSTTYCGVSLNGANGVLWDPELSILWAVGSNYLTGYTVGGTAAAPTLTEDMSLRITLPTAYAKDIQSVNGNPNLLWVTTSTNVYQYNITTKSWAMNYDGHTSLNTSGVRSISNQPDGNIVVEAVQDGHFNGWTTRTISFYCLDSEEAPFHQTRFRSNMAAYRARVWNADYWGQNRAVASDYPIAVTDQANAKIVVFDPEQTEWNSPSAVLWSWAPSTANGFSDTTGWYYPSDVKLRNSAFYGGQVMAVAASGNFCGLAAYPSGNRLWSTYVGVNQNPHAVELLPDGNIAIASSTAGWVRIYTSSQGPDSSTYVQYNLPDAHGALWDPLNEVLWVLGEEYLAALEISGTAAAPIITEKAGSRAFLPTKYGHDLQPVYGNADRLWVTTVYGVYQYEISTGSFKVDYTNASQINVNNVKGIGNQPHSQTVVRTVPNNTFKVWNTNTIDIYYQDAEASYETRSHMTGAYYKARIWSPYYH